MATLDPFVELLSGEPIYWRAGSGSLAVTTNTLVRIPQNVLAVTGSAEAVAVATGTPAQTHAVTVATAAVVETVGTAAQTHALTGAVSSVAQASGTLTLTRALTGTVVAVAEAAGTLEQVHAATGSVSAVAVAAGAGSQTHKLTAGSVAVAEASGTLTVVGITPVTGTVDVVAEASGIPEQTHAVTVSVDAVAVTAGVSEQTHKLTAASVAVAEASGTLTVTGVIPVTGSVEAVTEAAGIPAQTHAVTVDVDASVHTGAAPPRPYLDLPGTNGHNVTTPDHADFNLNDTFFLGIYLALDDWTPGTASALVAQWVASGNQRSFHLRVSTAGAMQFRASDDGITNEGVTSGILGYTDGTAHWVGCDFDGGVAQFYEGGTDSRTPVWVAFGGTQTFATVTTIHDSTGVLEVGSINSGTALLTAGEVHRTVVYSDLARTGLVADFNGDDFAIGDSDTDTAADSTGKTWTINGTGSFIRAHGTALEQIHKLTADVQSVASTTGALTIGGQNDLVGSVQAVSVTTGALQQTHVLTVAVDAVVEAAGTPTQTHQLVGDSQAVVETAATVDITKPLNGAAQAVVSVTATAVQAHRLTADSVAVTVTTATLKVTKFLTVDVEAVASVVGTVTVTVVVAVSKGFNGVDDALVGSLVLADASVGSMGVDDA